MIFDAKHEMIRKLVRQFAETELTTEVLDKVEALSLIHISEPTRH